jgi:hypothetical protein
MAQHKDQAIKAESDTSNTLLECPQHEGLPFHDGYTQENE